MLEDGVQCPEGLVKAADTPLEFDSGTAGPNSMISM